MRYPRVRPRPLSHLDPDYVPIVYRNKVHCTDHVTEYGDVIQLGHCYRRTADGIWVCVNCEQARP